MPDFSICLTFKGGRGHCYITVLNSDIPIDKIGKTECHSYSAPKGTYDILFQGVSPEGGATIEVKNADGEVIARRSVAEGGYYGKKARVTI